MENSLEYARKKKITIKKKVVILLIILIIIFFFPKSKTTCASTVDAPCTVHYCAGIPIIKFYIPVQYECIGIDLDFLNIN